MGKTLAEATVEVTKAADFLEYYASMARLPLGVELADGRPNVNVAVRNEPVGIVLLDHALERPAADAGAQARAGAVRG